MKYRVPLLSVIIAWNRAELAKPLFRSLSKQRFQVKYDDDIVDCNDNFEVIAVGNGEAPDWLNNSVRYIRLDGAGPSQRRNAGFEAARGKALVFIDDDAVLPPCFMARAIYAAKHYLENASIDVIVGGPNLGIKNDMPARQISDLIFRHPLGSGFRKKFTRCETDHDAASADLSFCNVIIPFHIYERQHGLDTSLPYCEDHEFFKKAEQSGVRFIYDPALYVWHRRRSFPAGHMKQVYNWGKYNVVVAYRYPKGFYKRRDNLLPFAAIILLTSLIRRPVDTIRTIGAAVILLVTYLLYGINAEGKANKGPIGLRLAGEMVFLAVWPFHLIAYMAGQFAGVVHILKGDIQP